MVRCAYHRCVLVKVHAAHAGFPRLADKSEKPKGSDSKEPRSEPVIAATPALLTTTRAERLSLRPHVTPSTFGTPSAVGSQGLDVTPISSSTMGTQATSRRTLAFSTPTSDRAQASRPPAPRPRVLLPSK